VQYVDPTRTRKPTPPRPPKPAQPYTNLPGAQPDGLNPFNPYGPRAYGPLPGDPSLNRRPTTPAPRPVTAAASPPTLPAQPTYPVTYTNYAPSYGGGGGHSAPAPDPNAYGGLPWQYNQGARSFLGDLATYYANRGAEKQAQQDYYNLGNAWSQRTGVPLVPDDWLRLWPTLQAYRTPYAAALPTRTWTMGDAIDFLGRVLPPTQPPISISYLRTGEI